MPWCWNCERGDDEDSLPETGQPDAPITEQPSLRLPRALLKRSGPNITQSMIELSQQCSIASQERNATISIPREMMMHDADGKPIFYVSSRDLADIYCELDVNQKEETSINGGTVVLRNKRIDSDADERCHVSLGKTAKCFVVKSVQTDADGGAKNDVKQSMVYFVKEGMTYVRKYEVSWCESSVPTEITSAAVDPVQRSPITIKERAHTEPLGTGTRGANFQVPPKLTSRTFHLGATQNTRTYLRRSLSESSLPQNTLRTRATKHYANLRMHSE